MIAMKTTGNKEPPELVFSKGSHVDQKFSNILQEAFVRKLSLVQRVRKNSCRRRIHGWDGPLLLSKPRQGGWRGRAQWEKEQRHQGEPVFSKGAFQGL